MSAKTQVLSVDLPQVRLLLDSRDAQGVERTLTALAGALNWHHPFSGVAEAARQVLLDGEPTVPQAGLIYYGLVLQCDHQPLGGEWLAEFYERAARQCPKLKVEAAHCELLKGIIFGRTPHLLPMRSQEQITSCFMTDEEGLDLAAALARNNDLQQEADEDVYETIYDHLIPTLSHTIPEGHGFYFLTM
ncbi:MAG TPA: hypothetical protein PK847_15600 [Candidatus Sumerlaeota bacterium]|nr:MAG: hypothetical protein BWZ08_01841 [candidate division BRC1 bacterium ADurb.BinA292]HOE97997.1 hypothetical protein [Candidatus Sumerlaeota bacterium]